MVSLLYGAGLRVAEATRLRVKDVDVSRQILTVRNGKGGKDRSTLLPQTLRSTLQERIATIRQSVREQSAADQTPVSLPFALDRKYPGAGTSAAWQWLFPSANLCCDDLGRVVRHHVHTSSVQKAVKAATAPGASPAACPSASLTHLKSSRSIWATVREAPGRVDRAIS
jgi:integrase